MHVLKKKVTKGCTCNVVTLLKGKSICCLTAAIIYSIIISAFALVKSLGSRLRCLLHCHVHVLVAVESRAIGATSQSERRFAPRGRQIIWGRTKQENPHHATVRNLYHCSYERLVYFQVHWLAVWLKSWLHSTDRIGTNLSLLFRVLTSRFIASADSVASSSSLWILRR